MSRRAFRAGAVVVPVLGTALVLSAVGPAGASSHKEAPLIAQDAVADATDVYAFVSPDKPDTVTLVANYVPLSNPAGGPNFDRFGTDVLYRINIDNNGDAVPDIQYDFRFTDKVRDGSTFLYATGPVTKNRDQTRNVIQSYSVARTVNGQRTMIGDNLITAPANVGPVTTPDYMKLGQSSVNTIDNGGVKVFAGPRADPFFVDLGSAFDLFQLRPFLPAYKPAPRAAQKGINSIAGFNVQSLVLQVPIKDLTRDGQPLTGADDPDAVIGVHTTSYRYKTRVLTGNGGITSSGPFTQVSRLGNPLVNEVVIPLSDKDRFNASKPVDDAQFAKYVLNPVAAKAITQLYGVPVPSDRTKDLVPIFLTGIQGLNQPPNVVASEQLRLNMGVPPTAPGKASPLGVLGGDLAGFPNGRRLGDDVVDIGLRALAGGTPFTPKYNVSPNNDLGDGVNKADAENMSFFPYVAPPFSGYSDPHGKVGTSTPPVINP